MKLLTVLAGVLQFSLYRIQTVIRLQESGIKRVEFVGKVLGVTYSTFRTTLLDSCDGRDTLPFVFCLIILELSFWFVFVDFFFFLGGGRSFSFLSLSFVAFLNLFSEAFSVLLTPPVAMFLMNSCFVFT